jgi:hypothetical protein
MIPDLHLSITDSFNDMRTALRGREAVSLPDGRKVSYLSGQAECILVESKGEVLDLSTDLDGAATGRRSTWSTYEGGHETEEPTRQIIVSSFPTSEADMAILQALPAQIAAVEA